MIISFYAIMQSNKTSGYFTSTYLSTLGEGLVVWDDAEPAKVKMGHCLVLGASTGSRPLLELFLAGESSSRSFLFLLFRERWLLRWPWGCVGLGCISLFGLGGWIWDSVVSCESLVFGWVWLFGGLGTSLSLTCVLALPCRFWELFASFWTWDWACPSGWGLRWSWSSGWTWEQFVPWIWDCGTVWIGTLLRGQNLAMTGLLGALGWGMKGDLGWALIGGFRWIRMGILGWKLWFLGWGMMVVMG